MKKILFALVASLALAGTARAVVYDGDVNFGQAINFVNPGLQAKAVVLKNSGRQGFTSAPLSVNLENPGDTASIDLFVVRTLQTAVAADDFVKKAFSLVFDFGQGTAVMTGTSYAERDGLDVYGVLDFDGPVTVALGNAQALVITLKNVFFNRGTGVFAPGKANGTVVAATFELATVPLPASLPLGLGALGLLGLIARRRKAAAQA